MILIDEYSFGRIVIVGREYNRDIIIFPDHIKPNWWRREGHKLYPDDLKDVIEYNPEYLIVGCGANCMIDVPFETKKYLEEKSIKIIILNTYEACRKYNEMVETDIKLP